MSEILETIFKFGRAEFALNNAGQLSERQSALLSQYRRINIKGMKIAYGAMFLSTAFWFGMWLWGIGLKYEREKHYEFTIAFFAAVAIVWLLFLFFLWLGQIRSHIKSGKISVVEGVPVKKTKKLGRGLGTAYYAKLGGVKFRIETKEKFDALRPDTKYRINYVKYPPLHLILSVAEMPIA